MNRKLDFSTLLLFTALLFGIIVRFYPVITNGFPLNDGGMFYTMLQDLKANGYALPQFTTYNHADIPFAYPPLGFYIAASLSNLLPVSDLTLFLYLPALVNTLSIFVFYFFAKEILGSRLTASFATLIYALSARAFVWQVMGGGITRAFGMFFLLLMLWQLTQLFSASRITQKEESKSISATHPLVLSILFGACTVTSHPQTALHAALGGFLIFLFYGFHKRGFISAILTGLGVAIFSAPWWATVISRHGIQPFISAGQTSQRTIESFVSIIQFNSLGDYLFLPTLLFALMGIYFAFKQKSFFLLIWIFLALIIDPRGGEGIALLPLAILASSGFIKLAEWMSNSKEEAIFINPKNLVLLSCLITYFLFVSAIFDFQLVNTSLKSDDLEMIKWINENIDEDKTFLLASGREFSMTDPLQEWFPALTKQYSRTTMQGLEWTLAEDFFPYYEQLQTFQKCSDIVCVNEWAIKNNVEYDYFIILIPAENEIGDLVDSLRNLGASTRSSALHLLIYESEHAMVFEIK